MKDMGKRIFMNKRIWAGAAAFAVAISAIILRTVLTQPGVPAESIVPFEILDGKITRTANANGYSAYADSHAGLPLIGQPLVLAPESGPVTVAEGESVTLRLNDTPAKAALSFRYKVISAGTGYAEASVSMDGETPFFEASSITLRREFLSTESPQTDQRGNQLGLQPVSSDAWLNGTVYDSSGYRTAPLLFALSGKQSVTITAVKNDILLESITWFAPQTQPGLGTGGTDGSGRVITVEAEQPARRNDLSIAELCDRTSVDTTPCFNGLQVWNALGGAGWAKTGQRATWEVEVEKAGYYSIAFRYLQNFTSGTASYRSLLIDGKSPFAGAESLRFPYGGRWQTLRPTDETGAPAEFYLGAGVHQISMEVTMGEMAQAAELAQKSLYELNMVYRDILMLTGSSPDAYRDYQIAKNLPESVRMIENEAEIVSRLSDWMVYISGGHGSESASLDELARLLQGFAKNPESIPSKMSDFQNGLSSFSTWLQSRLNQPLTLDKFDLIPRGMAYKPDRQSFFSGMTRGVSLFFKSFAADYGSVDNPAGEDSLEVWISMGRDQYQILNQIIERDFTVVQGVPVKLKLVSATVLQAIAAGIAPDVYLFCGEGEPVNLAVRGGLADLTQYPDFDEVSRRFDSQALVPYTFDGGVYALPLTQSFDMMFVRNDILGGLGLKTPQTWDDVFAMLSVLQQNKMEFAYPIPTSGSVASFALMLFRDQQNFYSNGGKKAALDTEAAMHAFEQWVSLYTEQQLLMSYSFTNRFKTGDMPIGIASLDTYNTLEIFAPEIRGLWSMLPLPGVRLQDGSIQRYGLSTVTGAFITKQSRHPDDAWEFLKWFTGAQAQTGYAAAIENRLGLAGRYNTANLEAFETIDWSAAAKQQLALQRGWSVSVEQVPGGYFLGRHLDNIFRKIVNEGQDVRETVRKYTQIIDDELTRKRTEFGLEAS